MAKTYRKPTLYSEATRLLRRTEHVQAVQTKRKAEDCASRYDLMREAEEALQQRAQLARTVC